MILRRTRKGKNITDANENIANLRNEKSNVAKSQAAVHLSWARLYPFYRKNHTPSVDVNDNPVQETAMGNISSAGVEPGFDQAGGSNLPNTTISIQKRHCSTDAHNNSSAAKDSARPILDYEQISSSNSASRDQVARPSTELIRTLSTKRLSTPSKDGPRVSSKRIKKGIDKSTDHELVQAESREIQLLQREMKELKAELEVQKSTAKSEKAKAEQYAQSWGALQQEVKNRKIEAKELLMQKRAAELQGLAYQEATSAKMRELQQENIKLTSALRVKEDRLTEYRKDIAKLSNQRPDSKRDDHYFEQHFSQLFRSIQSWVLQYYSTVNPKLEDSTSLHPIIQEFLTTTVTDGQEGLAILQTEPLYTIQAYIMSQIASHILRPVLLGLVEDGYERLYGVIAPCASAEELIKWRISTINIISRGEEFSNAVAAKAEQVANELVASLDTLLPDSTSQYKPAPRTRKLKVIVEQAAKLALEVQQEPSAVSYQDFGPATTCVASCVSDVKGLTNEEELQAMGALVRLTVYPAVVRTPYSEQEGVVLVKAKVLAGDQ